MRRLGHASTGADVAAMAPIVAGVGPVAAAVAPIAVAAWLDARFGEPPLAVHPVPRMGRLLDRLAPAVPSQPPGPARAWGAAAWSAGLAATSLLALVVERATARAPVLVAAFVRGVALWPLVSLRMLTDEVAAVEGALAADVEAGRAAVVRLVSRPVVALDEAQVREAAISSLAENLVDGWTAPLLAFAVAGLPGAAGYRWVNTADAVWGRQDDRWRHGGTVAARADDVVNLLPARATGRLLAGGRVPAATLRAEAGRTPSPNGGWPMGAVAVRLGIHLTKPGVYALNPAGRAPAAPDTVAAIRLVRRVAWTFVVVVMALRLASSTLDAKGRPCRR